MQQQEQEEIIKLLLKELETNKLELLRMQQQSGELYPPCLSDQLKVFSNRSSGLGSSKVQPSCSNQQFCMKLGTGSFALFRQITGNKSLPASATALATARWLRSARRFRLQQYSSAEGEVV